MLKSPADMQWKSKEQREKDRTRAMFAFLALLFAVFLFLAGAGIKIWRQYRDVLMENQYEQIRTSARILSGSVETSMKEYIWDFRMLEEIQDKTSDKSLYQEYLDHQITFVNDLFWMDEDGKILSGIKGRKYRKPVLLSETDSGIEFYQMEDEKENRYIVLKEKEPKEEQLCMVVDEEAYYNKLISNIKVGKKGYVVIKNAQGRIIMHPEDEQWGIDVIEGRKELYPDVDLSSRLRRLRPLRDRPCPDLRLSRRQVTDQPQQTIACLYQFFQSGL